MLVELFERFRGNGTAGNLRRKHIMKRPTKTPRSLERSRSLPRMSRRAPLQRGSLSRIDQTQAHAPTNERRKVD
jgi:hypothetical protein